MFLLHNLVRAGGFLQIEDEACSDGLNNSWSTPLLSHLNVMQVAMSLPPYLQ